MWISYGENVRSERKLITRREKFEWKFWNQGIRKFWRQEKTIKVGEQENEKIPDTLVSILILYLTMFHCISSFGMFWKKTNVKLSRV